MSEPAAGGWAPYPGAARGSRPLPPLAPDDDARHERVVGLGALCKLQPVRHQRESSQHFSISEFVLLANGRRILLHCDRGFTLDIRRSPPDTAPGPDVRDGLTIHMLTDTVLGVVRPETADDEPPQEDHPWEWLSELAQRRGLQTSVGELRLLRYEVVIADDVQQWLQQA